MNKIYLPIALTLMTMTSMAATSGNLLLKGTIAQILNIAITAESVASSLDLSTTQADTKVATVQEKSNSKTGYKVTISSQNLGKLKNGTAELAYGLKYNGATLNLSSSVVQTYSSAAAVTTNKNVTISYTGVAADLLVAGDYTDTLTFTIAAN